MDSYPVPFMHIKEEDPFQNCYPHRLLLHSIPPVVYLLVQVLCQVEGNTCDSLLAKSS